MYLCRLVRCEIEKNPTKAKYLVFIACVNVLNARSVKPRCVVAFVIKEIDKSLAISLQRQYVINNPF